VDRAPRFQLGYRELERRMKNRIDFQPRQGLKGLIVRSGMVRLRNVMESLAGDFVSVDLWEE
jgi:hypothetical protein